jgi:hypothetical protein
METAFASAPLVAVPDSFDDSFEALFADDAGSGLFEFLSSSSAAAPVERSSAVVATGPHATKRATHPRSMPARKPSPTESADPDRNARMAKANRDRHKQYVAGLEKTVDTLTKDNAKLQADKSRNDSRLSDALAEIERLRSTLANQSAIATALSQIGGGLSLAFDAGVKRAADSDSDSESSSFSNKRSNNATNTVVLPFHINIQLPASSLSM